MVLAYKRNQIEEAIARVLNQGALTDDELLRTRLKRLLDTDRALGRKPRSDDPERNTYAFYSDDPPGRGVEVWFSEYEGFALLNGMVLMGHGWPQGFAVRVLRRARRDLEQEHAWILTKDWDALFDQDAIREKARAGDVAFDVTDPVLLAIISVSPLEDADFSCTVSRGTNRAFEWARQVRQQRRERGGALTFFEVGGLAHFLRRELAATEPKQRGRAQ
jgi:hypothetical protein